MLSEKKLRRIMTIVCLRLRIICKHLTRSTLDGIDDSCVRFDRQHHLMGSLTVPSESMSKYFLIIHFFSLFICHYFHPGVKDNWILVPEAEVAPLDLVLR